MHTTVFIFLGCRLEHALRHLNILFFVICWNDDYTVAFHFPKMVIYIICFAKVLLFPTNTKISLFFLLYYASLPCFDVRNTY